MLSLSRLVSLSSALWPAVAGGSGRIVLCRSCARTLRRSLSSVQVSRGDVIELEEEMTVSELAKKLKTNPSHVTKMIRNIDDTAHNISNKRMMEMYFPFSLFERLVKKAGHTPQLASHVLTSQHRNVASLKPRPPVVTVMGHVDHGKTTLLDSLRRTSVAAQEAGGITQHIGAFSVKLSSGHHITFLDTPGHAAFSNMRARGAGVTDIVVLVVAADDGVMEQTRECIQLVKQARVPVVVAINKCDKYGVDVSKIKRELLQHSVFLEEFGGDVQAVEISALEGDGLEALEEAIVAQSELCDVRGDPSGPVEGTVIESKVDKGLGPVATVIVKHGTLTKGDILVAGHTWGKIRTLLNEQRKTVKDAPPSTPVVTVGWKEVPSAGDKCLEAESEQRARQVCAHRADSLLIRRQRIATPTYESQTDEAEERGKIVVPLIVKGDVAGSVEAIVEVIKSRHPEKFELKVIQDGVGAVSESDVEMAAASGALILGFNVSSTKQIAALAKSKDVHLLSHNIIYKLLDALKDELAAMLSPEWEEEVVGEAEVLKVFKLTGARSASVGGCRVRQGRLTRSGLYRIIRDDQVIHQGSLTGMKQGREDIELARKDTECGVSFSKDPGFREGDKIVCLNRKRVLPKLNWDLGF